LQFSKSWLIANLHILRQDLLMTHIQAASFYQHSLKELFAADPGRVQQFTVNACGIRFDFSKTHLTSEVMDELESVLISRNALAKVNDLFAGACVNGTEGRSALHTAWRPGFVPERDASGESIAPVIRAANEKMQALVERWRQSDADTIIHIGIGGSALGPELGLRALEPVSGKRFDVRLLANVDGEAFVRATAGVDPRRVRVVVASKSWTTQETAHNAARVRDWLIAGGVENPGAVMAAVTQKIDAAKAWGIPEDAVLPNPAWVGGRYALWSPIGLPVALQCGWDVFQELRAGAAAMDRHFRDTPVKANPVWMAAWAGYLYAEKAASRSRALFCYDERLRLLPSHLSQVELESLGKSVDVDGVKLAHTCPALWGGTGTDAQHAVFQYLHQGTDLVPLDFIAVQHPNHNDPEAHRLLLGNCFAQGAALMQGRDADETLAALKASGVAASEHARLLPHQMFTGNRPSTMILLERFSAHSLGALIAFYEHRTFAQSLLWNTNPFDQFGVELGKVLTAQVLADNAAGLDASTQALARLL
jgi:glucose-6-phosphate isomerase